MVFFKSSREALAEITRLYDFIWPTVAAMWNLRWQVKGYVLVNPEATQQELINRFVKGSGVNSVNFKASIIERDWEDQLQDFAQILLTNIFAIHESWLAEIMNVLDPPRLPGVKISYAKEMEFPTNGPTGILYAIGSLCSNESTMLKNAFYAQLLTDSKNSIANLDNLLKCYRFFKECRNCCIHHGGYANARLVARYQEFAAVSSPARLDVKEVPRHSSVSLNDKVKLDLRGVVGFSDVVIRIITTCDAELARSIYAEKEFESVYTEKGQRGRTLKKDPTERSKQVSRYVRRIGYPVPLVTNDIEQFLLQKHLVY